MKLTQTILTAAAISCFALSASADTTFFFHDGDATIGTGLLFDNAEGSIQDTQGSFTLTAEAFLDGVSTGTDFNGAGSGFGVNATGTGDETQFFDDDLGTESIIFSFDIEGTFVSLDLAGINIDDEATLSFSGGGTYNLSNATDDFYTIGEAFTSGQEITLSTNAAGAIFSLESFTVVPEPGTFALLSGCAALTFVMLRRRSA
ncbi:MAG TPA: hypothetical protein DEA90_13720 [Opitutae bacterium]|nr:hypothetical protein [Puniceicoccaceae bacterium]HBR95214.1 hypothetical protein [Opitutae bacterium]|tara:strand:- start:982 stop:1590 length:609 start_codon:yes stop_codon:yes gene_type:complete